MFELENYHNNKSCNFHLYDDCLICNIVKKNKIYEEFLHKIFEKYVNNNSVVIEGGCHIGLHSVKLSKLCKQLYCFEPLDTSFELLSKNLKENKCNNVKTFNKALSNNNYKIKFNWITSNNPGGSGLDNNPMGNIMPTSTNKETECITIDNLKLNKLDFIKLDIEGYEPLALEGALNTIKKYKPIIVLECWADHSGNASLEHTKTLYKDFIELGYSIEQISHSDYLLKC